MDGALDKNAMFSKLHSLGAKPIIKIRKNASYWYTGSKYRRREMRDYRDTGYERWSSMNNYGTRWPGMEGIFSTVKCKFGENTLSRSTELLTSEGHQRFCVNDEMKEYGENHSEST